MIRSSSNEDFSLTLFFRLIYEKKIFIILLLLIALILAYLYDSNKKKIFQYSYKFGIKNNILYELNFISHSLNSMLEGFAIQEELESNKSKINYLNESTFSGFDSPVETVEQKKQLISLNKILKTFTPSVAFDIKDQLINNLITKNKSLNKEKLSNQLNLNVDEAFLRQNEKNLIKFYLDIEDLDIKDVIDNELVIAADNILTEKIKNIVENQILDVFKFHNDLKLFYINMFTNELTSLEQLNGILTNKLIKDLKKELDIAKAINQKKPMQYPSSNSGFGIEFGVGSLVLQEKIKQVTKLNVRKPSNHILSILLKENINSLERDSFLKNFKIFLDNSLIYADDFKFLKEISKEQKFVTQDTKIIYFIFLIFVLIIFIFFIFISFIIKNEKIDI